MRKKRSGTKYCRNRGFSPRISDVSLLYSGIEMLKYDSNSECRTENYALKISERECKIPASCAA